LLCDISDMHKELYGFRPRFDHESMSFEELEMMLSDIMSHLEFERELARREFVDGQNIVTRDEIDLLDEEYVNYVSEEMYRNSDECRYYEIQDNF
jgi:hypothetical protein